MTKYSGTFYDLETESGLVKTNLRETPKLQCQEGYGEPRFTKEDVANHLTELLLDGTISEQRFLEFINRYPDELL
jgi:hypothetical protein